MFPRDPAVFRRGFCEFPRDRAVFRWGFCELSLSNEFFSRSKKTRLTVKARKRPSRKTARSQGNSQKTESKNRPVTRKHRFVMEKLSVYTCLDGEPFYWCHFTSCTDYTLTVLNCPRRRCDAAVHWPIISSPDAFYTRCEEHVDGGLAKKYHFRVVWNQPYFLSHRQ